MPRIRSLYPAALTDRRVVSLSPATSDFLFRLRTVVDDHGIISADPHQVAILVYPGRSSMARTVVEHADELRRAGLVVEYTALGGAWWALAGWAEAGHPNYQRVDRPAPATCPGPDDATAKAAPTRGITLPLHLVVS